MNISEKIGLVAEIYFQYWKIAKSDKDHGAYEPENSTREYGIKAGVVM